MIIFNTTFRVEPTVVKDFLFWIEEIIIPEIKEQQNVIEVDLLQLIGEDNEEGYTLPLQIKFPDMGTYNLYFVVYDSKLKIKIAERYQEKVLYFSTLLKKIK